MKGRSEGVSQDCGEKEGWRIKQQNDTTGHVMTELHFNRQVTITGYTSRYIVI